MSSSYDRVPYPTRPFAQTHPDRLATVAALFGVAAPEVSTARVLELGCGAGGNLLAMAATLPRATFTGIDSAPGAVAAAQEQARRAGLANVSFAAADIEGFDVAAGGADYVIAHGVFSWVPDAVRTALLDLCARALSPNGIAYVSYNALPGGRLRGMLREALALHLAGIEGDAERLAATRELLGLLRAAADADPELAPTLSRAAREVADRDDAFLFHDVLSEDNEPFAVDAFVSRARAHGLDFLSEAQFSETRLGALPSALQPVLGAIADPVRREGYLDMLKERRFRQTLLCRADRAPRAEASPDALAGLAVSAKLRVRTLEDGRTEFAGPGTARVVLGDGLVAAALHAVAAAWPAAVWVSRLAGAEAQPHLREALLRLHGANLVELHSTPPPCARGVPDRPRATTLARAQAAHRAEVSSLRHAPVALSGADRALLARLDGTQTRAALGDEAGLARLGAAALLLDH